MRRKTIYPGQLSKLKTFFAIPCFFPESLTADSGCRARSQEQVAASECRCLSGRLQCVSTVTASAGPCALHRDATASARRCAQYFSGVFRPGNALFPRHSCTSIAPHLRTDSIGISHQASPENFSLAQRHEVPVSLCPVPYVLRKFPEKFCQSGQRLPGMQAYRAPFAERTPYPAQTLQRTFSKK